jgi:spore maturation protein SpmB
MIITYGPKDMMAGYQGLAYEGVPFLPWLASKVSPVLEFLFGFESPKLIAFPLTSLGSTGAALALIPTFIKEGILTGNEVAVFTSIGLTWSGYLSTHIAMMDALASRKLASKAILSHTIAGLLAAMFSHFLYTLL